MTYFTEDQTHLIDGPAGQLELLTSPGSEPQRSVVAVICHPLPTEGGTMTNKVVTTLHRVCRDLGVSTVRFNFRGVGRSQGHFDQGRGELDDLKAVLSWVQAYASQADIWLMGFSFGSYIAATVASQWPCKRLVTVAPPVHHYDYPAEQAIPCPWVVLQGDQDDVVPPEQVYAWLKTFKKPPYLLRFNDADHFFHGRLIPLRDELKALLVKLEHGPL